jgi:4-hydroxybenzoate polyprenyltransferase
MREALPRPGFFGRITVYLKEMYPLPRRALTSLLAAVGFRSVLGRIQGLHSPLLSPWALLCTAAIFAFMLILRLMDELKDVEIDRALFPDRPVPSGRVLESDVWVSLVAVLPAFWLAHVGTGIGLGTATLLLGYALLMFKWFFVPGFLRPRLLPTLATHTPVIPLLFLHLVVLFCLEHRMSLAAVRWTATSLLIGMYWALAFAWEIARKIRAPQSEDAYVTYSRLLGQKGAVLLAGGAASAGLVAGLSLFRACPLSWVFVPALVAGWAGVVFAQGRFLLTPNERTSRLAPWAEFNLAAAFVAGIVA